MAHFFYDYIRICYDICILIYMFSPYNVLIIPKKKRKFVFLKNYVRV